MAALSPYLEKKLLEHALGIESFTAPSGLFLSLHTREASGSIGVEVDVADYARLAIAFDTVENGLTRNTTSIDFEPLADDYGNIHFIGLYDAVTDGNLLFSGLLPEPIELRIGERLVFATGDIAVGLA